MTVTDATTRTIHAPGATLAYDVRGGEGNASPPLLLFGSPTGPGERPLRDPRRCRDLPAQRFGIPGEPDAFAAALRRVLEQG